MAERRRPQTTTTDALMKNREEKKEQIAKLSETLDGMTEASPEMKTTLLEYVSKTIPRHAPKVKMLLDAHEQLIDDQQVVIEDLQEKLTKAEAKVEKTDEHSARVKTELARQQDRQEANLAHEKLKAFRQAAEAMLPLYESAELALQAEPENDGLKTILAQAEQSLAQIGVTKVAASEGEKFDVNTQQAIQTVPVDSEEQGNKIQSVFRSGFVIKQGEQTQLIRPAMVTVGKFGA